MLGMPKSHCNTSERIWHFVGSGRRDVHGLGCSVAGVAGVVAVVVGVSRLIHAIVAVLVVGFVAWGIACSVCLLVFVVCAIVCLTGGEAIDDGTMLAWCDWSVIGV